MGPAPLEAGFLGELFSRSGCPFCPCWAGHCSPRWLMETASWADPPLLVPARPSVCQKLLWAAQFTGATQNPPAVSSVGAGGEANPAVNPFPTKPPRAGARHPQGGGAGLRGSSLFLKKQDLLSFSMKLKANLFSSSSLLVTNQIAAQRKKILTNRG